MTNPVKIPLSASIGGAPILLNASTFPGTAIHVNEVDSGYNDFLDEIQIFNPNIASIILWVYVAGPGITPPAAKADTQLVRINVNPTPEGNDPTISRIQLPLGPGFTYYAIADIQPSQAPLILLGSVNRWPAVGAEEAGGYGGLETVVGQSMANLGAGWVTVPFEQGMVSQPKNVTQDPGNNQIALLTTGVWQVTINLSFNHNEDTGSRETHARIYNVTQGLWDPNAEVPIYTGRNSPGSHTAASFLTEILTPGYFFRLDLGNGDTYTSVNMDSADLTATKIDELP